MAYLTVLEGPTARKTYLLDKKTIMLGREEVSDIVLSPEEAHVSRKHARITRSGDKFLIDDLRSRNGTFVNNARIQSQVELEDRDEIRICEFLFRFHDPEHPRAAESIVEASIPSTHSQALLEAQPAEKVRELIAFTNHLGNTLDLDGFLAKVVESLFGLFKQADRGFIILCEETNERDATAQGLVLKVFNTRRAENRAETRYSTSIVRECLKTMKALLIYDAAKEKQLNKNESVAELRNRSIMCAPMLMQDDKAFGVIQLDTPDGGTKFTQADLGLFMAVAGQASVAMDNVRLHKELIDRERLKRDLLLAQQWQRSFLPQELPAAPGYQFYAYYEPAQEVGGDYYDFIPIRASNTLALVLGDVAGKGVQAALLMAKLSSDARFTIVNQADPGGAISVLNDLLYRHTSQMDSFVTLAAALLDTENHTVTFVNAGHPSPLLFRHKSGSLEEVTNSEFTGLPLGVIEGCAYQSRKLHLEPGDIVFIFSDGIPEAMDVADHQLKDKAFKTVVREGIRGVKSLGERVVDLVKLHASGRNQSDDITLVAFGRLPE